MAEHRARAVLAPHTAPLRDLVRRPVPLDMQVNPTQAIKTFYDVPRPWNRVKACPLTQEEMIAQILEHTRIGVSLRTLGKAFASFGIPILTTPTLVVTPNKEYRGYLFLNPSQTANTVSTQVNIASATYTNLGTTAATNVSGHRTARVFMTVDTAAGTSLTVDAQSQDPQTGNWVTVQQDIFGGFNTAGSTEYANLGELGVDVQLRFLINVTGSDPDLTFTLILKEIQASVIAGQTIFLSSSPDVTTTTGFPLLGGQSREFWLRDNTPLYAVAAATGATLQRFDLQ